MDPSIQKLPGDFVERLKKIIPVLQFQAVLRTFIGKRPVSFRINTVKTDRQALLSLLREVQIKVREILWYRDAFILQDMDLRDFQETRAYRDALVYVQGLSSMIPVVLLDPHSGERVLDMCASPGSKTTQIACCVKNASEVIAVEKMQVRLYKLLANLKLQGATCVTPVLMDGSYAWKRYPQYFDRILVDAPCSSEAQFLTHEPRSFGYWSIRKVKEMAYKQRRLLFSALHALKTGGILVYSTCTFAPEENESVIDWALRTFGESIAVLPVPLSIPNVLCQALSAWEGRTFHSSVRNAVRIIPNQYMEGFFCAVIRKIKDINFKSRD